MKIGEFAEANVPSKNFFNTGERKIGIYLIKLY